MLVKMRPVFWTLYLLDSNLLSEDFGAYLHAKNGADLIWRKVSWVCNPKGQQKEAGNSMAGFSNSPWHGQD